MACKPITADVAFDCTAPQEGGIEARIVVINYDDWKASTVTVDGVTNEITGITLAAGGIEGYEIQVPNSNNIIATEPLDRVEGVPGYRPQVAVTANKISQAFMEQLAASRFGKVVVIVEMVEGRSYLYGGYADGTPEPKGIGLKLIEDPGNNPGDAAIGGTVTFTWGVDPNDPPQVMPRHLIASSFDIDDLLTPTS